MKILPVNVYHAILLSFSFYTQSQNLRMEKDFKYHKVILFVFSSWQMVRQPRHKARVLCLVCRFSNFSYWSINFDYVWVHSTRTKETVWHLCVYHPSERFHIKVRIRISKTHFLTLLHNFIMNSLSQMLLRSPIAPAFFPILSYITSQLKFLLRVRVSPSSPHCPSSHLH